MRSWRARRRRCSSSCCEGSSGRSRKQDLRMARYIGGKSLAKARKAFHQAATELAFYRFRVARGIKHPDLSLEAEHFHTLGEIQKRISALTPTSAFVAIEPV